MLLTTRAERQFFFCILLLPGRGKGGTAGFAVISGGMGRVGGVLRAKPDRARARSLPQRSCGSRRRRRRGLRPVHPPAAQRTEVRRQRSDFYLLPAASISGAVETHNPSPNLPYPAQPRIETGARGRGAVPLTGKSRSRGYGAKPMRRSRTADAKRRRAACGSGASPRGLCSYQALIKAHTLCQGLHAASSYDRGRRHAANFASLRSAIVGHPCGVPHTPPAFTLTPNPLPLKGKGCTSQQKSYTNFKKSD